MVGSPSRRRITLMTNRVDGGREITVHIGLSSHEKVLQHSRRSKIQTSSKTLPGNSIQNIKVPFKIHCENINIIYPSMYSWQFHI